MIDLISLNYFWIAVLMLLVVVPTSIWIGWKSLLKEHSLLYYREVSEYRKR